MFKRTPPDLDEDGIAEGAPAPAVGSPCILRRAAMGASGLLSLSPLVSPTLSGNKRDRSPSQSLSFLRDPRATECKTARQGPSPEWLRRQKESAGAEQTISRSGSEGSFYDALDCLEYDGKDASSNPDRTFSPICSSRDSNYRGSPVKTPDIHSIVQGSSPLRTKVHIHGRDQSLMSANHGTHLPNDTHVSAGHDSMPALDDDVEHTDISRHDASASTPKERRLEKKIVRQNRERLHSWSRSRLHIEKQKDTIAELQLENALLESELRRRTGAGASAAERYEVDELERKLVGLEEESKQNDAAFSDLNVERVEGGKALQVAENKVAKYRAALPKAEKDLALVKKSVELTDRMLAKVTVKMSKNRIQMARTRAQIALRTATDLANIRLEMLLTSVYGASDFMTLVNMTNKAKLTKLYAKDFKAVVVRTMEFKMIFSENTNANFDPSYGHVPEYRTGNVSMPEHILRIAYYFKVSVPEEFRNLDAIAAYRKENKIACKRHHDDDED